MELDAHSTPAIAGARGLSRLCFLAAAIPLLIVPPSFGDEYDDLLRRAETGDLQASLDAARARVIAAPGEFRAKRTYLIVLGWAGKDSEAVDVWRTLPAGDAEDAAVIEVVARAFRNLGQPSEALQLYQRGAQLFPDKPVFRLGQVLVHADSGDIAAVDLAERLSGERPSDPDFLAALGYAYMQQGRSFEALGAYDRALILAPDRRDLKRERVAAMSRAGLAHSALKQNRSLFAFADDAFLRGLELDAAAELVRLSRFGGGAEAERFVVADRAIRTLDDLIARWTELGPSAAADVLRARFDRMAALHARARMVDVVAEYEALRGSGVHMPDYILSDVGSALLALQRPVEAEDLYRQAIAASDVDADSVAEAELGLFYAMVENERIDEARQYIEAVNAKRPVWTYAGGVRRPNEARLESELAVANAQFFADDLISASQTFDALVENAPGNTSLRTGRAAVWLARGWPRQAEADLLVAQSQAPRALAVEVQQGYAALDLAEWRQAASLTRDVIERFPENAEAQDLADAWRLRNKAEIILSSDIGSGEEGFESGEHDRGTELRLYSAPIGYNVRLFGLAGSSDAKLTDGDSARNWTGVGLDWQSRGLTFEAEISSDRYGDTQRTGGALKAEIDIDDHWQVGGQAEVLSRDIPLQAVKNGVTSSRVVGFLRWRESEQTEITGLAETASFSDGNERVYLEAMVGQRLLTQSHSHYDAGFEVSVATHTRDDVPYYSPREEALAISRVRFNQIIYRFYDAEWEQTIELGAGVHWQRDFDAGGVYAAEYRQAVRPDPSTEVSGVISVLSRPYDGDRQTEGRAAIDLAYKF